MILATPLSVARRRLSLDGFTRSISLAVHAGILLCDLSSTVSISATWPPIGFQLLPAPVGHLGENKRLSLSFTMTALSGGGRKLWGI
jgi:hypothetical protein